MNTSEVLKIIDPVPLCTELHKDTQQDRRGLRKQAAIARKPRCMGAQSHWLSQLCWGAGLPATAEVNGNAVH